MWVCGSVGLACAALSVDVNEGVFECVFTWTCRYSRDGCPLVRNLQ